MDHATPPIPLAHPDTHIVSINSSQLKKLIEATGLLYQQGHMESLFCCMKSWPSHEEVLGRSLPIRSSTASPELLMANLQLIAAFHALYTGEISLPSSALPLYADHSSLELKGILP